MSATTFACPHCDASYPRKPVLVGRAVRCTTCKNAFRLREDGVADKIVMDAPAPSAAPAPVAAAPVPPPQPSAPAPVPIPEAPAKPSAPKLASSGWGLNLDVEVEEPAAAAPAVRNVPPPAAIKSPQPYDGADYRK